MEVREGYKKTEVGVIPEDWECAELGELIQYVKGFAFKSKDYTESGIRIIRVSDTTYNSIKDECAVYMDISRAREFDEWKLYKNDIILSTVGSKPPMFDSLVGKAILVSKKYEGALLNQNAVILRSKKVNQKLIYNNLKRPNYIKYIETIFRGNANQASITLNDLFKFQFALPIDPIEQQAITEALSDVDDLISSLTKLINKKKNIKQGAMQELLTGKKRLDGFSGEWEVVEFKDIFIKHQTKNYQINSVDYMEVGSHPVIDQGKKKIVAYSERKDKLFSCPTEGIIVFGDHTRELKFINFDFVIGADGTQVISTKNDNNVQYYYYSLMEKEIPNTGYNRHYKYLLEMKFYRPKLEEQTAIASILSDMDAEIEALEQKLNKYKAIKQGMMHELLNGRIRLI
ncbi:MAG: restriction endonuclease subunit S [Natronincolaceae bacterium]